MSITYCSETKTFFLDGKNTTYAFFVADGGYLTHLYYGAPIGHDDIRYTHGEGRNSMRTTPPGDDRPTLCYNCFSPELSFYGTGDFREPAVLAENATGDRLTNLLYHSHEILAEKPAMDGMPSLSGGETLVVHLLDSISGFGADLYYTVYDDASVIARRTVYVNGGTSTCMLRRAYSFSMGLCGQEYDMMTLHGGWGCERIPQTTPLSRGVFEIDSKRHSSSATMNPFMGVYAKGTTENTGDAYGVSLVYSSSFSLKAEGTDAGDTLLTGGINDFDFCWELQAGARFETPEVVLAYSDAGIGGMSRAFHDAFRNHLISPQHVFSPRPIVINNWEATYFNFTTEKLKSIVDAVAGTGIDTFVLDDGWFGKRDDDRSGLGDWVVNTQKMEGGLTGIIDHVHAKGMKFGLWFEPEMVNEDSDLFRAHPDFAIGAPMRGRCYSRHQFMLDLTRADVRDYIVEAVNKVLRENAIDYVKWDCNRCVTDTYTHGLPAHRQAEFAHRYALGLYDLCERIVKANPHVFFEGCSSGGARFDPAMFYYFPQIWTSDDSDAEERTRIQYGTSIVYPLSTMSCHISEVPNHQTGRITPIDTRADIAHLGATGYELDTSSYTDADRELARAQVNDYRATEELMLRGDLYRLDDPFKGNFFTVMVVSKDQNEALLTVYRRLSDPNPVVKRITLAGLAADKIYRICGIGENGADIVAKGSTLMRVGIPVRYHARRDFWSESYQILAE